MNDAKLGDFLVKIGLITPAQLHTAREMLEASGGKSKLANVVVSLGFATAEELARLAATALRLPYVSLDKVNIPKPLVGLLNKEHARKAKGILVKAEGKKFYLATFDPTNVMAFDELQFVLGGRIYPVVATEEEVVKAVGHYYTERIQYDRSFDLPMSDTLDYEKPELFDIRAARAKKQAAKQQLDVSSGPSAAGRKAAEDRLAAAASALQKRQAPQQRPAAPVAAAPNRPALEIRDEAALTRSAAPKAAAPAVAAPPSAPEALGEELPAIRDAAELETPVTLESDNQELEVLELEADETAVEGEIVEGDLDDGEATIEGELEPLEEPAAAAASADDLLSLFGAMAFGGEPGAPAAAAPNPEADELAKLFMGALGGSESSAKPGAAQPADGQEAGDLAKELAQMLLG